ncbi:predicted protein [Paecilomyces variotii No. 5]|uniref:Uncharacterized protein n=1 Tax=Byssochlamys spectabilis (strain No. 5 / NBRC 109023) TaxID=1356009 RepID=V5GAU6_BYSSN|nr:predicted protein [Paecilomyces variotii No. 5]
MADFLFPAFEERIHSHKRLLYPAFLTDLVRGASDAIEALELFRGLLLETNHGPQSMGFMAFDAHGGDTACHLRAGMLLEVFSVHRQLILDQTVGTPRIPLWINKNIQSLEGTRERARKLCAALTYDRVHPTKLGLGAKDDTSEHILSVLGWKEPFFPRSRESLYSSTEPLRESQKGGPFITVLSNGNLTPASFESPESPENPDIEVRGLLSNQLSGLNLAGVSLELDRKEQEWPNDAERNGPLHPTYDWNIGTPPFSPPRSPSSGATPSIDGSESEASPLQTRWDLLDSRFLVRFIVFSYILSKYKTFFCFKDVVGARLYPEGAVSRGYELMEQSWDFKNVEYKKAKLERMSLELRALQMWLSDFSCAWLQSLSMRDSPASNMTRLLLGTVQKSAKGLTAAACYPGYILLRNELAREEQTFVMIDRHFCPHGIHFNVFLADLHHVGNREDEETRFDTRLEPVDWKVRHMTLDDLYKSPNQSRPHPVIMGNSIQGASADYIARLSSHYTASPVGTSLHDDSSCQENVAHIESFLAADHDRLALSFFAAHKSYSFPLANGQDEVGFVGSRMEEEWPGLREKWLASREELSTLGGGEQSLHLFGWQHMFVDTKERLAHKLDIWIKNEELMPLSADVTARK